MCITINNIARERRIDLPYQIKNFDASKEVQVISVFSDNIQYEFTAPWTIELELGNKLIIAGTYTRRELIDLIEGKIKLTQFDGEPRINRMNKLTDVTEVVLTLNELDNANNLKNRKPSNTLFTYHMTAYEDSMHLEPYAPQNKKLKNREIIFLTLRITHIKNNIMTDGLVTTVVLHV